MPSQVLPDVEAVTIAFLAATVDGDVGSHRWEGSGLPFTRVTRIGGTPAIPGRLDAARLQIDVWAADQASARLAAATAQSVLHQMPGHLTDDTAVTAVRDDLGLTWLPDDVARYLFGVTVYAHPRPVPPN